MLPSRQNLMPLSYGLTTVSVTFPDFPYYYEALTDTPAPQTYSYADKSCKKCKLEKINALKRQVCEVVKKYDSVEIDGKEILGWYILLSTEDREIIKEYGNLTGFLKCNPSLLIVNNQLKLKGEPDLTWFARSGEDSCCSLEDNPKNTDHKYNTDYPEVCNPIMDHSESTDYTVVCSKELYTHEAASTHSRELVREVVNCKENVWFDQAGCFKLQEASSEISKYKYTARASMVLENKAVPNEPEILKEKKHMNDSSSANLGTGNYSDNKTVNLTHVEAHCSSAKPIDGSNQVTVADIFSSSYVQPDKISHKWEKNFTETWKPFDHTEFAKEGIVSGSKRCSDFQDPSQELLEKDGQNVCQQQKPLLGKSEKPIDQECSASEICDDETFLSIKSGSYSRSSSFFSLDDHSDTESCLFEEALEDLSSNYLCSPKKCYVSSPDVQSSSLPRAVIVEMNNRPEMTAKQHRNVSCNTDFSCVINCHSDKATQTKGTDWQEMDVNTDITFPGIFVQGPVNVGDCQDMKDCRRNEAFKELKQRVVRAELKLLDVQRWMCWQLCWKTQQQCMEQHSFATFNVESAEHSQAMAGFNLLSALTEVEEKYLEIKSQIQSGMPLDSLVPLSMQLTKVKTPPYNLLNQCFMETCKLGIQKGSAGHSEDLQKNKPNCASTCLLSTPKDLQKEIGEDSPPKRFSPEPNRYYVHVGNLALLVTEVDLKTAFEKFNVSEIFLEESSVTSSYAILIFTCSEKAQAAVKEMDGKMFMGKKLKVRVVKNSTQNFQLASQEIKVFSATLPEAKTKPGTGEPQSFSFQPQPEDVSTFSKPIPHSESQRRSNWENRNIFSNIPYNRASSLDANQAFPSASMYSTTSVFGCTPLSPWPSSHLHLENRVPYNSRSSPAYVQYSYPLYTIPVASPFSYQAPVNTMCKPSVNLNSNVKFLFGKNEGFGVQPQPTERYPVHNNTVPVSSSTRMLNKGTSTVTPLTIETAIQPVKEPASVITKSSENKGANSESVRTKAACVASSISPITTTSLKMPVVSDNCLPFENKTTYNSGRTSFTPAAPLRSPKFVPNSVTIPENDETCYSTIAANIKDPLTQPSNTDFQQSGSLPLKEVEWDVRPKLSSELPVFIPIRLNLSQFEKVMDYLLERHTDVTRDDITNALAEIIMSREDSLRGLTLPQIVKQASSKLSAKKMP
ncbi:RNA-binding protein 44 [Lithobates pipiens]